MKGVSGEPTDEERKIVADCLQYLTGLNYRKAWDFWMKLDDERRDAVVSMCMLVTSVNERASLGHSLSKEEWPPKIKRPMLIPVKKTTNGK